jgi:ribosomal silencing factor RsfS
VVASVNPQPDAPNETQSSNVQQGKVKLFDWMVTALLFDQHQENQMKEWVLLDTGSTVNVFCNPDMVKNIVKMEKALIINKNAGEFSAEDTAELPWSDMKIWFDPHVITNVLSLGLSQEKYHVHYDNAKEDTIFVETPKGTIPFRLLMKYLYVYHPNVPETNMLTTLKEQKLFYTSR